MFYWFTETQKKMIKKEGNYIYIKKFFKMENKWNNVKNGNWNEKNCNKERIKIKNLKNDESII
jgi:hypothetical protein